VNVGLEEALGLYWIFGEDVVFGIAPIVLLDSDWGYTENAYQ
jgi:hypothetical protein